MTGFMWLFRGKRWEGNGFAGQNERWGLLTRSERGRAELPCELDDKLFVIDHDDDMSSGCSIMTMTMS